MVVNPRRDASDSVGTLSTFMLQLVAREEAYNATCYAQAEPPVVEGCCIRN